MRMPSFPWTSCTPGTAGHGGWHSAGGSQGRRKAPEDGSGARHLVILLVLVVLDDEHLIRVDIVELLVERAVLVHHVLDVRNGQRGLGYVGGHHAQTAIVGHFVEHLHLLLAWQQRIQWQYKQGLLGRGNMYAFSDTTLFFILFFTARLFVEQLIIVVAVQVERLVHLSFLVVIAIVREHVHLFVQWHGRIAS